MLGREGFTTNHKKLYRLYCEEHLAIRRKKRKRVAQVPRQPKPVPSARNERWSMDFVHDTLFEGTVFAC
jgi:putative transposase